MNASERAASRLRKFMDDGPNTEDSDGKHYYIVDVNVAGETEMSRKFKARSSDEAAAMAREEFEASKPAQDLPSEYEVLVSRRFVVKSKRIVRDLEMRDCT